MVRTKARWRWRWTRLAWSGLPRATIRGSRKPVSRTTAATRRNPAPAATEHRSTLQTLVTGPGTLRFWWKVSCEPGQDALKFEVSGTEQCRITGDVNWEQRTIEIPRGSQTLAWTYRKQSNVAVDQDAGWLDQVVFTPASAPPVITTQPANQPVKPGSNAAFPSR